MNEIRRRLWPSLQTPGVIGMLAAAWFGASSAPLDAATTSEFVLLDFGSSAGRVSGHRFEEDGFALESRLSSGVAQNFAFRNPLPGALNLNGVNTVPYNGSTYIVPFTSSIVSLWNLAAKPFSLISIDVAEYSALPNLVTSMRFTGLTTAGTTVIRTLNINRPVNGLLGDFQTLTFNDEWSSLQGLTIVASDSNFRFYNGFSMDNLVLEVIPEPTSLGLAMLAPGMLLVRRRSVVRSGGSGVRDSAIPGGAGGAKS